jgi:hypothetical protein
MQFVTVRFALIALLCCVSPAWAKKPPLRVNVPEVVKRYFEVHLHLRAGKLSVGKVIPRFAPQGKPIVRMAGPFRIQLLGAGKALGQYEVSFPLLGPGELDASLLAGMTADTEVVIPAPPELDTVAVEGPGSLRAVKSGLRWRRR